jgi:hypothetical protein
LRNGKEGVNAEAQLDWKAEESHVDLPYSVVVEVVE